MVDPRCEWGFIVDKLDPERKLKFDNISRSMTTSLHEKNLAETDKKLNISYILRGCGTSNFWLFTN